MSPDQIAEERRRGRTAGVAAIGSALLLGGAEIWSQSINGDAPAGNGPAALRFFDNHRTELIAAAVLRALGLVLLVVVAVHLYRAIKARRPDEPRVVLVTAIYGPLAWAIGTVAVSIALAISASDFTGREFQTIDAADDAFRTAQLIGLAALSGLLALAFWLVKGCLDAMRAGLLNRFMGVLGIVLGPALVVTPFGAYLLPVWVIALRRPVPGDLAARSAAGVARGASDPMGDRGVRPRSSPPRTRSPAAGTARSRRSGRACGASGRRKPRPRRAPNPQAGNENGAAERYIGFGS